MKRVTLNLLLVAALVLGVVAPVFAQDDAPDSPDAANRLFLPAITQGGSALSSDQDDDLSAPVTMVSVDAASLSRRRKRTDRTRVALLGGRCQARQPDQPDGR